MILKGSQRGGGGQLAAHLFNERDNDHITLHELRGFMADDLDGALAEAHAISKATKCKQYMFSLSLNPPKGQTCDVDDFIAAADRAGRTLGLNEQPRAIVFHEKEGRRHAHAVWSRIDGETLKAVQMGFYKNKLTALSKELYLEHGWDLPDGHKENGWKNPLNFTLAEWQQAKRLDLHPAELKQLFQEAWSRSDGLKAFRSALEENGFHLAAGDRRGFVAVDFRGEVFSVSRMTGAKTKELTVKLGSPDGLPGVDHVRGDLRQRTSERMQSLLEESRTSQRAELSPLLDERRQLVAAQRQERRLLQQKQDERRRDEAKERQGRLRTGLPGLWDMLTGRADEQRRQIEREAFDTHRRDVEHREWLFNVQFEERQDAQRCVDDCLDRQRRERMQTARQIAFLLNLERAERSSLGWHETGPSKSLSFQPR